ncbi:MAG TPA: dihydropteroate synthase [Thermohalobaculum sp.]|nr:dihydropteroate synthase [Thermohalobaculum sp.]
MSAEDARPYLLPVPCPRGRPGSTPLAGGPFGFAEVEVLRRGRAAERLPAAAAAELYPDTRGTLERLAAERPPWAGLDLAWPRVLGVVNVTPDSFSDGGRFASTEAAVAHGRALVEAGADALDIGGESTRPGAEPVPEAQELDRVIPVIEGLVAADVAAPISIDTRRAGVARAALAAGASILNDVSALTYDEGSAEVAAGAGAVCLMHAQGDPRTMQKAPRYGDVLLEVYDFLERRVAVAERAGVARERIAVDPGIGFGKTLEHNLALIRGLGLLHGLGCPVLLGASRKRFIGTLAQEQQADRRAAGSIAAALAGLARGAQIVRVHDVAETVQALRVWLAIEEI